MSLWSWLLTLPIALTVMNMFLGTNTLVEEGDGTALIFAAHLVLGLLGFLLRPLITARSSPGSRMTTAFGAFAFLGACRPLVVAGAAGVLNIADLSEDLWARVLINAGAALVVLPVLAVLVDSVRGHALLERRLRKARATIQAQLGFDEDQLRSIRSSYVGELSERLEAAFSASTTAALDRSGASHLLRTIADEVVRPMSHRLFHDHTPWPVATAVPRSPSRAESVLGLVRSVRPAPVGLPVLLFAILVGVRLLTQYGALFLLVQWVAAGVILLAGNIAAARLTRRTTDTVRRLSVMVLCYVCATAVSASVTCLLLDMFGFAPVFYWNALWAYPLTAVTISVLKAADRQLRRHQLILAHSLNQQLRLADRTHQQLLHTRRRVARVLHNSVQGNLIASALAMAGPGSGLVTEDPSSVRNILSQAVDRAQNEILAEPSDPSANSSARIQDLLSTWERVLNLTCEIEPEVWNLCDDDPARADAIIEVLSEGFTNAIRHGEGNSVRVSMSTPDSDQPLRTAGEILVTISSPGRLQPQPGLSLGMTTLQALVSELTLSEEGDNVVLRVVVA
ncbi:sensor histidine kinase [Arthrobacter terricola]|uniref:hypothetical protein n=1 Tax=Arthrobacter terricola TaxID=2547396 RepID=UPI0010576056|nr:hypothetical protein [Arthrobacter terricola]